MARTKKGVISKTKQAILLAEYKSISDSEAARIIGVSKSSVSRARKIDQNRCPCCGK